MAKELTTWIIEGASSDAPFLCVEIADSFLSRFLGLMGRRPLPDGQALFLSPCSSVHMCFMRFSIDVVYVRHEARDEGESGQGAHYRVVKVVPNLWPWLGVSACLSADAVLELRAGEAARLGLAPGVVLFGDKQWRER